MAAHPQRVTHDTSTPGNWRTTTNRSLAYVLAGCVGWLGCRADRAGPAGPVSDPDGQPGAGEVRADGVGAGAAITGVACDPNAAPDAAANVLRRLTKLEYQLTLQELLALDERPEFQTLPDDAEEDGFRTVSALHTISPQHMRAYADNAAKLAEELMGDNARRDKVLGCAPDAEGCLRSFVRSFSRLAYRRPVPDAEVMELVGKASEVALNQIDQYQFALEVMLTSPHFLFRTELGDRTEGLSTLAPHELAARLSFALWGRGPSASLLEQAASGALDTREGVSRTAKDMLSDPRAREFFAAFFEQWLGYGTLRAPTDAPEGWSDHLLADMSAETARVVDEFAWGMDGTKPANFLASLTANHTYLTPALATFFKLPSPANQTGKVTFPPGDPRENSGLLTHPALISSKSDGDPIATRGNWVRKAFLCESLTVPAGLLESVGDELVGLTRMEIIAERNDRSACAGCHSLIDPIGVGYAQFDTIGRFDAEVDLASYPLAPGLPGSPDPTFQSMGELAAKLRSMPRVTSCLSSRLFLYAEGRKPTGRDSCVVESVTRTFIRENYSFESLIQALVETDAFRLRRVPGTL